VAVQHQPQQGRAGPSNTYDKERFSIQSGALIKANSFVNGGVRLQVQPKKTEQVLAGI